MRLNLQLSVGALLLLLFSCQSSTNESKAEQKLPPPEINIKKLLKDPFDLYAFKEKKQGAENEGEQLEDYHLLPDTIGKAYCFYNFQPEDGMTVEGNEITETNAGYLGTDKKTVVNKEEGLIITTFHQEGKFQHLYLNPEETLLEVRAEYNDFDLPELAFVGLTTMEVYKKIGKETFKRNECLVYTHKNTALVLKMASDKVKWLRLIQLNEEVTKESNVFGIYRLN